MLPRGCSGTVRSQHQYSDPGVFPVSNSTERFSSRVGDYARYRPSYPAGAIALLQERCGLGPRAVVADIGSGTGILTALLLPHAAQVFAVEPNDPMRAAADASLGGDPRFVSVRGTAEATTLAPGSVDLLVAGQAFHWFKVAPARAEALRITRPGAFGALLWNEHPTRGSAFLADYERLLRRHASEFEAVLRSRVDEPAMREYLGGAMECVRFPNQQSFDYEGLRGRLMSSSYAPEPGHPEHLPLIRGLEAVFARHQRDGRILFPYVTLVYFGRLRDPA
ncbi:MAG: class I SAM-dependent methyltransferase [Proteobacteria bacterium]|nr:class I SAM-dependent methyltransferase [Pseudomonadota bacterium]